MSLLDLLRRNPLAGHRAISVAAANTEAARVGLPAHMKYERRTELRYHSTGGPCGWKPDPRLRRTPKGNPIRVSPGIPGVAITYTTWGYAFIGTPEGIDWAIQCWDEYPAWVQHIFVEIG